MKSAFRYFISALLLFVIVTACRKKDRNVLTENTIADHSDIITTIGGTGQGGLSGDGGPALKAEIYAPWGVTADKNGNVYLTDEYNRIRKIDRNGIISTFAGNDFIFGPNSGGFSGDNGPAVNAKLKDPVAICTDDSGNVFICDYSNNRIRKVNTAGIITTVAGSGTYGFSGDSMPATAASLKWPWGIAIDKAGNLFFSDSQNGRIRKIDAAGIITTIAGNGTLASGGDNGPAIQASLKEPGNLNFDNKGNLYFVDYNSVRKIDTMGIITTIAGNGYSGLTGDGGPAVNARVGASGVAADAHGNIFITDWGNNCIRKINSQGIISTFAGGPQNPSMGDGGPASKARLFGPTAIFIDHSGAIYFADTDGNYIRKITP